MRYLRLYLSFLRFSFSRALEFRIDFLFRIVMDLTYYAVHLTFFTVLYGHTTSLGGWTLDQVYVFLAGYLFCDAMFMTVFANNLWFLPIHVNQGQLDYDLVRPVPELFLLSLRQFAANSFVNLLMAGGLVVWALHRYPGDFGPLQLIVFGLFLALGSVLYYLIRLTFIIPVFWMHSTRGLDELSWSLSRFAEKPIQIYPPALELVLRTLLPVAFLSTIPAEILFLGLRWQSLAGSLVVAALFALAVRSFWQVGLRAYSSASS